MGCRSLLDICGKPLIVHQIRIIREMLPDSKVVVVCGPGDIKSVRAACTGLAGIRFFKNGAFAETGSAHSVYLGARWTGSKKVLIVYGDLVFTKRAIFDTIRDVEQSALLAGFESKKNKGVGVVSDADTLSNMTFGVPVPWLQIAFLTDGHKKMFIREAGKAHRKTWLFHEVLNAVVDRGAKIAVAKTRSVVRDIDTRKDYLSIIED